MQVIGELLRRTDGQVVATTTLHVADGPDVILAGDYPSGILVPMGQTAEIVGTVTTPQNVVVQGTLRMRPGSTLRFRDVNESQFVGGHSDVPLATDVGLWVVGHGVLDAQGTPRQGWNRFGDHVSWQAGDEILAAPTAFGDMEFRPHVPGDPVPQAYSDVPATEVVNLTRDVTIEGTVGGRAHIQFLHAHQPQTVRWAAIRHMGVPAPGDGRYALHLHKCGDGSRGSLVEGVVVRDSGRRGFVAHHSHGVTFRDCIAYDIQGEGFWWDEPPKTADGGIRCREGEDEPFPDWCNMSDDTLYDHCLAGRVNIGLTSSQQSGFNLTAGRGNACLDCVAVAVDGNRNAGAAGFTWPARANQNPNVWRMEDCVAHNNVGVGIFVWQNDAHGHVIDRFTAYHNGRAGVEHGAYINPYRYRDLLLVANSGAHGGHKPSGQIVQHANSAWNVATETPAGWERVVADPRGRPGPAVVSEKHNAGFQFPIESVDCVFHAVPAFELNERSGTGSNEPAVHRFVRCLVVDGGQERDMEPSDVLVTENANGCTVEGVRRDGTTWSL